jgi:hypothetical protein
MSSNIFLDQLQKNTGSDSSFSNENIFLNQIEGRRFPEKKEGFFKNLTRTALQPIAGYSKRYSWPLDILKLAAEGGSQDILSQLAENEPELKDGIAEKARQKAMEYFPTQSLGEDILEERTGIPLRPKTKLQKSLRLGSEAASFRAGGAIAKGTAGITAPVVSKGLQTIGIPEDISDVVGLLVSGAVPEAQFSKVTKTSGLPSRQFEKLKKPTKVSSARHAKINETLENDFRTISESILEKHPNYKSIKSDPSYKENLNEGFQQVEKLAEQIPEVIPKKTVTSTMKSRLKKRFEKMKGITSTESEESFKSEFGSLLKKVQKGDNKFNARSLVEQFRKNNSDLAEYFEPGKSKAFNTGKRDALLEYNRSIENVFEELYPESEFTNLFKEQNKRWSEFSDVDSIEGRLEKIFKDGKINFNEAAKILDKSKSNIQRPFKRIMGEKGFKDFEALLKDFMSVKDPHSLLKKAESAGFGELASLAGHYLLHPSLAKLKAAIGITKELKKAFLDKPQISITFKSAIDNLKSGNFTESEKKFKELDREIQL